MTQTQLKQRLTPLDALFFYFEKKEAPFNIGSTIVLDGEIAFEEFKAMMSAKLPLLPRYQQRLTPAPFEIGYPSWEFDPKFDINQHIFHLKLDEPGTLEQLRLLSGKLQSTVLSRNKPLWEIYVVDGLEGKRTALVTKVHHAMSDGISGVDLMEIVFDTSPNPPPIKVKPTPPPRPRPVSLLDTVIDGWLDTLEQGVRSWGDFRISLLNLAENFIKHPDPAVKSFMKNLLPVLTEPVTMLPFNRNNTGKEELAWAEFKFKDAHAVKSVLGGTVNDVGLTVLSGALSRYIEAHHEKLTGRTVRMMVPVSVRQSEQRGALGNLISLIPVEIPLDLKDPLERYNYITKKTEELKGTKIAEEVSLIITLLGVVPASLEALVAPITTAIVPLFNVVCTNVPGPRVPLYILGKHVTHSYPYVPTAYAVGLSVAIFSYEDKLFFGMTADAQALPDLEQKLKPYLEEVFAELEEAAGVAKKPVVVAPAFASVPAPVAAPEALETPVAQSGEVVTSVAPVALVEEDATVITPETGAPWPAAEKLEPSPKSEKPRKTRTKMAKEDAKEETVVG
jgi:diacylglycerol O-acyltransferase